jgi:hypothetical protein
MVLKLICLLVTITFISLNLQAQHLLEPNRINKALSLTKKDTLQFVLTLNKNTIYQFEIEQQGIAVCYQLTDEKKQVYLKSKRPDDVTGSLKSEFIPSNTNKYTLTVYRYPDPENTDSGKFSVFVKSLNADQAAQRQRIKKELASENKKAVLTLDIDHFWQAFDQLKSCESFQDSVQAFQTLYLDRATEGLVDFISVRELTAGKLTKAVAKYPEFYASIRKKSYAVKKASPAMGELFGKFQSLYANFKPFKVCFVVGIVNTGGTVSDRFVLIGTEVLASSPEADLSAFIKEKNTNKISLLSQKGDLMQKIRNIVAHECVHTQQKQLAEAATKCLLLQQVLREGICDFIGELVAGQQINAAAHQYGRLHEKTLWDELNKDLCSQNISKWLYNAGSIKDRPADLGYYMGYRIAQSYYDHAADKGRAITDIIEMTDPLEFFRNSRYHPNAEQ